MFSVPSSVICQMLLHYSTFPLYFQISPLLKRKLSCPYFSAPSKNLSLHFNWRETWLDKNCLLANFEFSRQNWNIRFEFSCRKMSEFVITLRDRKNSFLHPLKNFSFSRLKSLPGISWMGGYFYDYDGTKTRPNQETKGEPLAFFHPQKRVQIGLCGGGITTL